MKRIMPIATKELGFGNTPMDISVQNWALKLAKKHIVTLLEGKGQYASGMKIRELALELIDSDPKWMVRARNKVLNIKSRGTVK